LKWGLFKKGKMKLLQIVDNLENEIESELDNRLDEILFAFKYTKIKVSAIQDLFISPIIGTYFINENKILTILFSHDNLILQTFDQRGSILKTKFLFENGFNLKIASLHNNDKLVLLGKYTARNYTEDGDGNCYEIHNCGEREDEDRGGNVIVAYVLIFDEDLNEINKRELSYVHDVLSVAENNRKYYCLLQSIYNFVFLSIYDWDLKEIDRKDYYAKNNGDPFYFSSDTKQLRVKNGSIFILETGLIKEMNENTGIVIKQSPVLGSSFELIQNKFVLFVDENQVKIYDKSGRERNTFDLSDELKGCPFSFLSDTNLIGLDVQNEEIINLKTNK